jgi:hypothetical protein
LRGDFFNRGGMIRIEGTFGFKFNIFFLSKSSFNILAFGATKMFFKIGEINHFGSTFGAKVLFFTCFGII